MNIIKKIVVLLNYDSEIPDKSKSGYNLYSNIDCFIEKKSRRIISTGLGITIPDNYYITIVPRSELSIRGIDVNPEVIGNGNGNHEIKVLVINNADIPCEIQKGDKIAQFVINKYQNIPIEFSSFAFPDESSEI